jgi:archaellum component FlaC
MAVMMPRERWTDERLDHFEKRVDERFDNFERRVDERFDSIDEKFKHVDQQFKQVDERFKQVDQRLDLMGTDIRELRQSVDRLSESMRKNFIALAMLVVAAIVFF